MPQQVPEDPLALVAVQQMLRKQRKPAASSNPNEPGAPKAT
jgi:hypothetical protein